MTSFEQFEKEVNKFMENTGIRSFCKKHCKGACCCSVKDKCGQSCMNGKVPITCSLFICRELAKLLRLEEYRDLADEIIFTQPELYRWKPIKIKIGKDEEKLLKLIKKLDKNEIRSRLLCLKSIIANLKVKCRR